MFNNEQDVQWRFLSFLPRLLRTIFAAYVYVW